MIEDIKDRIPVNVLNNGAVRYGVYDENNNLLRYEYIKREDEPLESGTSINRGLFRNLQGDLYTVDRYNVVEFKQEGAELYNANLSIPLTSYEKGKKVCVRSNNISEDIVTSREMFLNINNLGAKKINGVLANGLDYTLIYNGESWDVFQGEYVIGTYVGDGVTTQTISLGFKPSAVIVANDSGMVYKYSGSKDQYYGGIAIKDVPAQYNSDMNIVEIVENGFVVRYDSSNRIYANNSGKIFKYIAFK